MSENGFRQRKLTSAICVEWLKGKKDFSSSQKMAVLGYVESHVGKTNELYDLYNAVRKQEACKIGTLELELSGEEAVLKIDSVKITGSWSEMEKLLQDVILILEESYPLGTVVDIDISEIAKEKGRPYSDVKVVIIERFVKKTDNIFVPYCGVVYPFGDIKKQILFTEKVVRKVIQRGYEDEQENVYVAAVKRELLKKGYTSYVFANAGDEE